MKRTQIYLDSAQAERIGRRAEAAGVTGSKVIREAVEAYLAGPVDEETALARQRQAIAEAFGSIPRLPSGDEFVRDVRAPDKDRRDELETRWRSR